MLNGSNHPIKKIAPPVLRQAQDERWRSMAGWTVLEPATFRVTGGRSIQAELPPHKIKIAKKNFSVLHGLPDVALA